MRLFLSFFNRNLLALKTSDDNDTKTIIGRHDYLLEDIPGRGILKYDDVEVFQTALPARGEDSVAMLQALQEEAEEMAAAWTGPRPNRIPVVPEKLSLEDFMGKPSVQEALHNNELPIGLDMIHMENVSLPLNNLKNIMLISDTNASIANVLYHSVMVISQLSDKGHTLFVDINDDYAWLKQSVNTYINGSLSEQLFTRMSEELANRKNILKLQKYLSLFQIWLLFWKDLERWIRNLRHSIRKVTGMVYTLSLLE